MTKHIYAHKRPGYGYQPGDVVTPEFAAQYPMLVAPAPDERAPHKAASQKDGDD